MSIPDFFFVRFFVFGLLSINLLRLGCGGGGGEARHPKKKILQISVKSRKKNTKSIISQKLRIAQEKSFMQKMSARLIAIYSVNLVTFEEI